MMHRPAIPFIEANRVAIGCNDAELSCQAASRSNLEFCSLQQEASNAGASIVPVHPEVVKPIVLSERDTRNRSSTYGDPGQRPILVTDWKRRIGPQSSVDFVYNGLHKVPHERILIESWAANLDVSGDLAHRSPDCNCDGCLCQFVPVPLCSCYKGLRSPCFTWSAFPPPH